jgi:hypothetical protein
MASAAPAPAVAEGGTDRPATTEAETSLHVARTAASEAREEGEEEEAIAEAMTGARSASYGGILLFRRAAAKVGGTAFF